MLFKLPNLFGRYVFLFPLKEPEGNKYYNIRECNKHDI